MKNKKKLKIEKNIKYELIKLKNKYLYVFENNYNKNKLIYIEMKKRNKHYYNNEFFNKYNLLRYNIKLLEINYNTNEIIYYLYKKKFSNNKRYETLNLNDIKYIKIYEK